METARIALTDLSLGRRGALILAAILFCLITILNAILHSVVLSVLYMIPIMIASPMLVDWQILAFAACCAAISEQLGPFHWGAASASRVTVNVIALCGVGIFVRHISEQRRMTTEVAKADRARLEAQQEARALLDTTPAAIFTVDGEGRIISVNEAASRLFGASKAELQGQRAGRFLPILDSVLDTADLAGRLRTMVEGSGYRSDGEAFYAHLWLSSYSTPAGPRLAAVVADASEQLRDRQESGLRQLLRHSHILGRAVSHEIRNLAAAASVLHSNLAKVPGLNRNEDFFALGRLVESLQRLASDAAAPPPERNVVGADIKAVLEELRIILKPSLEEEGIELHWEVTGPLPLVRGDHGALLEVFLNLAGNSRRALQEASKRVISVVAYRLEDHVLVRFMDSGKGVQTPDRLFQPFQSGTVEGNSTGLGLYVSRAILRTFGGEITYENVPDRCCFLVQLAIAAEQRVHNV
jgi:two-component system sensor kinase FixL